MTSLDEPKHLERPKPGWKQLGLLCAVVVFMIVGVVAFVVSPMLKHHLQAQETYQYHDYSQCGPGGFSYLEASAKRGDPGSQHLLQQLREKCREQGR